MLGLYRSECWCAYLPFVRCTSCGGRGVVGGAARYGCGLSGDIHDMKSEFFFLVCFTFSRGLFCAYTAGTSKRLCVCAIQYLTLSWSMLPSSMFYDERGVPNDAQNMLKCVATTHFCSSVAPCCIKHRRLDGSFIAYHVANSWAASV